MFERKFRKQVSTLARASREEPRGVVSNLVLQRFRAGLRCRNNIANKSSPLRKEHGWQSPRTLFPVCTKQHNRNGRLKSSWEKKVCTRIKSRPDVPIHSPAAGRVARANFTYMKPVYQSKRITGQRRVPIGIIIGRTVPVSKLFLVALCLIFSENDETTTLVVYELAREITCNP